MSWGAWGGGLFHLASGQRSDDTRDHGKGSDGCKYLLVWVVLLTLQMFMVLMVCLRPVFLPNKHHISPRKALSFKNIEVYFLKGTS